MIKMYFRIWVWIIIIHEIIKSREKKWTKKEKKQGYRVLNDGTIEIL